MRTLIVYLVLVQTALLCKDQLPCFRALIVQDVSTPWVQTASTADVERLKKAFSFVAAQTGLVFKPTVLKSSELSKKTLHAWLRTIRHSSKKEVAFFYYSGQGSNEYSSNWPLIGFGDGSRISVSSIEKQIKARKPKLGFVIFDCYGRAVSIQESQLKYPIRDADMSKLEPKPGLRSLFRRARGMITACSTKDVRFGCYSPVPPIYGGIFTINFVRGLFAYTEAPIVCWHKIELFVRAIAMLDGIPISGFDLAHCREANGGNINSRGPKRIHGSVAVIQD